MAAPGTYLGGGGYEDLNVGIGAHDRADIAPVQHGTGRLAGEGALELQQGCPHVRYARHDRGGLAGANAAQGGVVQRGGIEFAGQL